MVEVSDLTEKDKQDVVTKLAEKIKLDEESKLKAKIIPIEEDNLIKKAKLVNEHWQDTFRRRVIGSFQFLILSLFVSEGFLIYWMYRIDAFSDSTSSTINYERIVVGSLSIAILIAVLVVFTVVYRIKKSHGDCEH